MFVTSLLIGCAGGVGAILRASCDAIIMRWTRATWPLGTMVVNFLGCFLFGAFNQFAIETGLVSEEIGAVVMVGLFGGFTTFSTAMVDALKQLQKKKYLAASAITCGTFAGGCAFLLLGRLVVWLVAGA